MSEKNSINRDEFDREHMAVYQMVLNEHLNNGHAIESAIAAANKACDDFEARFVGNSATNATA